jgi:hypothetical protein
MCLVDEKESSILIVEVRSDKKDLMILMITIGILSWDS